MKKKMGMLNRKLTGRLMESVFDRPATMYESGARSAGAALVGQPWVDEHLGGTPLPGVRQIVSAAVAEVAAVAAAHEGKLGHHRSWLRKLGTRLMVRRARADMSEVDPADEQAKGDNTRGDSRRAASFAWLLLGGMSVAAGALDAVVFYLLGLPVAATWVLAGFVGPLTVVGMYAAGGHLRDRHDGDAPGGRWGWVPVALVPMVAAMAFGIMTGVLRTQQMDLVASTTGFAAPNAGVGIATFVTVALVIDVTALGLGYRFSGRRSQARQALLRRRGTDLHRFHVWMQTRCEARFQGGVEEALAVVRQTHALLVKVMAEADVALAAYADAACAGLDNLTGPVVAENLALVEEVRRQLGATWEEALGEDEAELHQLAAEYGVNEAHGTPDIHVVAA